MVYRERDLLMPAKVEGAGINSMRRSSKLKCYPAVHDKQMRQTGVLNLALSLVAVIVALGVSQAGDRVVQVDANLTHEERWNRFVERLYALQQRLLNDVETRKSVRVGGYYRLPKFYREVSYYDKKTGKLLSLIQWERRHPDRIHAIEVYIYDERGRVIRDYSAMYLTHSRNAPMQTLINLHNYNRGLHAFRQFDASGNRIYEDCRGKYAGKPVEISLDEDYIIEHADTGTGVMATPAYKACFKGLALTAGDYLNPH